jgi:hypothetical protein
MRKNFNLLAILLAAFCSQSYAQSTTSGTIKGFVYEKGTGEPMGFTNVYIKGTKQATQTDQNGYFSMPQLAPGSYTVYSTMFGYDTASASVSITAGAVITKKLYVKQMGVELKGVDISSRHTEKVTRVNIGATTITPKEIKLLPSAGGEPDIAQYLQVVPGVTFTGDQGGQLYIRGGSPAQTGILLDGVTIYNPFHSIGLYSVFETDAIRSADVYTAGFNATYGNRSSAILDIHTKDGNNQRLAGTVSASPIMLRGMLEGPLMKQKTPDGGSATFLLSIKHSYLDETSKSIYSGLGDGFKNGLPYNFTDFYGKVTFSGGNGSKLNLFAFNFNDNASVLDASGIATANFNWKSTGAGATFVVSPAGSSSLISGKFAYSKYSINDDEVNFKPRSSGIDGFEGGIDFTYFLPKYSQIKYGIEVGGQHTTLDYYNSTGQATTLDRTNTTGSLFFLYKKNFSERFILEPSVRLQYYSSISKFSPEPRIDMKYNLSNTVRLKAAAGLYSQNIVGIKSDRDVVNYFNGFVLSPDQQMLNTNRDLVSSSLEKAQHILAGIEIDVQNVEFNIEPWFKNFSQLVQLNRSKGVNQYATTYDFQADKGKAYGIDLSAKYAHKRVFLLGVISYQKIEYTTRIENYDSTFSTQVYPPPFDRRVNINLVGSYTLGKKKNWEVSMRFNYGSAFPFTQTQGFNENLNVSGTGLNGNLTQQNGQLNTLYSSSINGGRLTDYHRLDISVKKKFVLGPHSNIESTFSVTNVYDRNNIFYVNRTDNKVYYQLPVFPSLNLSWHF